MAEHPPPRNIGRDWPSPARPKLLPANSDIKLVYEAVEFDDELYFKIAACVEDSAAESARRRPTARILPFRRESVGVLYVVEIHEAYSWIALSRYMTMMMMIMIQIVSKS